MKVACHTHISAREMEPSTVDYWNLLLLRKELMYGLQWQVIAINNQFPGPQLETTTNYNLIINVHNELDEPLLITW